MSLSQPKLQNPCKKFIEFKGVYGVFQYWDKENKKNIILDYPIKFIVLDELSTITGFSQSTNSRIFSNEVKNLQDSILDVRSFKGREGLTGKYGEIKDLIKSMGGKFCRSIYVALINGKELELANFRLTGASFSAWMDKNVGTLSQAIKIEGCSDGKKGAVKYKIPNYEGEEVSKELMDKALEMDKDLQKYLRAYENNNEKVKSEAKEEVENDDIPF